LCVWLDCKQDKTHPSPDHTRTTRVKQACDASRARGRATTARAVCARPDSVCAHKRAAWKAIHPFGRAKNGGERAKPLLQRAYEYTGLLASHCSSPPAHAHIDAMPHCATTHPTTAIGKSRMQHLRKDASVTTPDSAQRVSLGRLVNDERQDKANRETRSNRVPHGRLNLHHANGHAHTGAGGHKCRSGPR
jgi:hypothetical protein